MNGEHELSLILPENIPWDKATELLEVLGRGAILRVNQSKLTPQKGQVAKLQVDIEVVAPTRTVRLTDGFVKRTLDCIATNACKVSTEVIKP